jgi:hypothetical protein
VRGHKLVSVLRRRTRRLGDCLELGCTERPPEGMWCAPHLARRAGDIAAAGPAPVLYLADYERDALTGALVRKAG